MTTFSSHKAKTASEKVLLAKLEAARKLNGWSVYSGSIYSKTFSESRISSISQDGTTLTEVSTTSLNVGEWYFDYNNSTIYIRTSDSSDPNLKFIACIFELHFATHPVRAAYDLASGYDVEWKPYITDSSSFGVGLEHSEANLGSAIEGSGSVTLINDKDYWSSRFDKYSFQNRRAFIYAYSRDLPITEAKLLYKGTIQGAKYSLNSVSFALKDIFNSLRSSVATTDLSDLSGTPRVKPSEETMKARRVYGYVYGHICVSTDQILQDYPLTGTVIPVNGSRTVSGLGTSFYNELSPGDEILIGSDEDSVVVDTINTDAEFNITEEYSDNSSGVANNFVMFNPSHPKKYANRTFKVAHHALTRPQTTLADVVTDRRFQLTSAEDFRPGDQIELNGYIGIISSIAQDYITLVQSLGAKPSIGDTIYRSSVQNVYIDDKLLQLTRDYTYSASNATITLLSTAEQNVAPLKALTTGTITITASSRTISGTSTTFKSELEISDWIKIDGNSTFFEIISIESDTSLTVRTLPAAGDAGTAQSAVYKRPLVYDEKNSVLSCDLIGKSDDGTTTGALLKYPNQVIKDILTDAGLEADVDAVTFASSDIASTHLIGLSSPPRYSDTKNEVVRDVIRKINRSAFTSIIQGTSFDIQFGVLSPEITSSMVDITEHEILSISVDAASDEIIKTLELRYKNYEHQPISGEPSFALYKSVSDRSNYLAVTEKRSIIETVLVEERSAIIMSARWRFMLEFPVSSVTVTTKLLAIDLKVNDLVRVSHPRLYQRFGSDQAVRIGLISSITKNEGSVNLTVNDLGNAFARCARIAENNTSDWDTASSTEKQNNGFITDSDGTIDNDESTDGINVIW